MAAADVEPTDNYIHLPLGRMLDVAINSSEGTVNFYLLHAVIHTLIQRANAQGLAIELHGSEVKKLETTLKDEPHTPSFIVRQTKESDDKGREQEVYVMTPDHTQYTGNSSITKERIDFLAQEMYDLRGQLQELRDLPANLGIIDAIKKSAAQEADTGNGSVVDVFHLMSMQKRVEAAEEGMVKLAGIVEDLIKTPGGALDQNVICLRDEHGNIISETDDGTRTTTKLSGFPSTRSDRSRTGSQPPTPQQQMQPQQQQQQQSRQEYQQITTQQRIQPQMMPASILTTSKVKLTEDGVALGLSGQPIAPGTIVPSTEGKPMVVGTDGKPITVPMPAPGTVIVDHTQVQEGPGGVYMNLQGKPFEAGTIITTPKGIMIINPQGKQVQLTAEGVAPAGIQLTKSQIKFGPNGIVTDLQEKPLPPGTLMTGQDGAPMVIAPGGYPVPVIQPAFPAQMLTQSRYRINEGGIVTSIEGEPLPPGTMVVGPDKVPIVVGPKGEATPMTSMVTVPPLPPPIPPSPPSQERQRGAPSRGQQLQPGQPGYQQPLQPGQPGYQQQLQPGQPGYQQQQQLPPGQQQQPGPPGQPQLQPGQPGYPQQQQMMQQQGGYPHGGRTHSRGASRQPSRTGTSQFSDRRESISLKDRLSNVNKLEEKLALIVAEVEAITRILGPDADMLETTYAEMANMVLEIKNKFRIRTADSEMGEAEQETEGSPMAELSPQMQLILMEDRFKDCMTHLDKLDLTFNEEISKLHNQFTDIEKDFNELLTKIEMGLPGGDSSEPNACCAAVYQKIVKMQADFDSLANTSLSLIDDREQKSKLMDVMLEQIEVLKTVKADREDVEEALADKADACAIMRKVSHDQFDNACEELSKGIEDALEKLTQQELLWQQALDDIQNEIGNKLDKMDLGPLREFINNKLRALQDKMKSLAALKRDQEAAGTKSKLLRDVNCISCDKDVVMRKEMDLTMRPKGNMLPPSRSMGPYLAYELDALRKQQKQIPGGKNLLNLESALGMKGKKPDDHICNRYCGGSHTVTTPQQRVTRLGHFLMQWGPEAQQQTSHPDIKKGSDMAVDEMSDTQAVGGRSSKSLVKGTGDSKSKVGSRTGGRVSQTSQEKRSQEPSKKRSSAASVGAGGEPRRLSSGSRRGSKSSKLGVASSKSVQPKGIDTIPEEVGAEELALVMEEGEEAEGMVSTSPEEGESPLGAEEEAPSEPESPEGQGVGEEPGAMPEDE